MFAKANYGVTPGSRVLSVPQFADTSKVMSTPKYLRVFYLVGHLKPTIPWQFLCLVNLSTRLLPQEKPKTSRLATL